jgi:hypothetical protein
MTVLGGSEILAVSKLRSAIRADFDLRGCAAAPFPPGRRQVSYYLVLFCVCGCSWIHSVIHRYSFLIIQTIKQITTKVPSSP